jgi:hypothetical protein
MLLPLLLGISLFLRERQSTGVFLIENIINVPFNYNVYSVKDAIGFNRDVNGDGKCDLMQGTYCTIIYREDNHFGFMGYRDSDNPQVVYNSGAIGSVTMDWINEND